MVRLDLVVSHYNEDLRWLKKVPIDFRICLYCKGDLPDVSFLPHEVLLKKLLNVGREAHSWASYLEEFCENPAEQAVFLQGHPFDHCHDTHVRLRAVASEDYVPPPEGFDWWGFIIETDDPMGKRVFVPWSKNTNDRELDIGARYELIFGEKTPEVFRFFPGGQFLVSGEAMRRNPKVFYSGIRKLLESDSDAAYCLERFWDRVFHVEAVPAEMMGQQKTIYLKQIKRLGSG